MIHANKSKNILECDKLTNRKSHSKYTCAPLYDQTTVDDLKKLSSEAVVNVDTALQFKRWTSVLLFHSFSFSSPPPPFFLDENSGYFLKVLFFSVINTDLTSRMFPRLAEQSATNMVTQAVVTQWKQLTISLDITQTAASRHLPNRLSPSQSLQDVRCPSWSTRNTKAGGDRRLDGPLTAFKPRSLSYLYLRIPRQIWMYTLLFVSRCTLHLHLSGSSVLKLLMTSHFLFLSFQSHNTTQG